MLVIRFNRVGKRNKAQFRMVVQEHTAAPGGRHVEVLGSYDPHLKKATLKEDRIKYWISEGAKPSVSAHNLLVSQGILEAEKIAIKMKKKPKKDEEGKEGETKETADKKEEVKEEKPEDKKNEKKEVEVEKKPEDKVEVEKKPEDKKEEEKK